MFSYKCYFASTVEMINRVVYFLKNPMKTPKMTMSMDLSMGKICTM